MNGYGSQLYGELRYWHPLPVAPVPDSISVHDAWPLIEVDAPRSEYEWAAAGTLPGIYSFPTTTTAGALPMASIPHIGGYVAAMVDGVFIYAPISPEFADETRIWGPDDYSFLDVRPRDGWPYTIEVRDSEWASKGYLTGWIKGGALLQLGKPSSLDIEIPGTDAMAGVITPNDRIVVRSARGFVIDVFEVGSLEKRRSGDAIYLNVAGQSQAVRLEREAVTEYSTPYTVVENEDTGEITRRRSYSTVQTVIDDLLDFQEERTFYIADIAPEIAGRRIMWSCDGTSILGAITELQQHLPVRLRGHIWVDYKRGLHWTLDTVTPAIDLSVGKHLTGVSVRTEYSDIITRLYPQGRELDDGTRLSLYIEPDPLAIPEEEGHPGYVDRNIDLYGVRSLSRTDNRILYRESLEQWAEGILDEYSVPRVTVRVDAVNAKLGGFDARDTVVGQRYRVVDTMQSISEVTAVQAISLDLANPLAIKLDVTNRRGTVGDLIKRLTEQQNEEPVQELTDSNLRRVLGSTWSDMATRKTATFNQTLAREIFGPPTVELIDPNDATQPVGESINEGDSGYAARRNHVHEGSDLSFGTDIQAVGAANASGDSGNVAHSNHVHKSAWLAYGGA